MPKQKEKIGNIAIALAILAIPIPFVIPLIIPSTAGFLWMNGPYLIWILEFFALILGIASRKTLSGKIAIVASILISSILVVYLLPVSRSVQPVRPVQDPVKMER